MGGRVPPPPLFVGLMVTGVLTALGLHNLSGILLLTPVEAMLLAAFASWHPHDG
jgi:type III secretory pathway component EscR